MCGHGFVGRLITHEADGVVFSCAAQTGTPGGGEVGRKPTDPARPGADYGIAAARAGLLRKERLPALAAVQCSARRGVSVI